MRPKRKSQPTEIPITAEGDILKITPLGAGNEVGRSCIVLEYKGKTVMMDCGLHPAYSGLGALPFFDNIDPASVDVLLVTHFHLDHAAGLPYFVEKTTFKGRIFMTHPTKAIFKWLLSDYVKVSNISMSDDVLYSEQDLLNCYEKIEVIDYHQQIDVEGIKFTPFNAGHVLGAAMFLIEIAGVRVLYTGDYSTEEDRHLMAAERPKNVVPEVLITESTYGVSSHQPRLEREALFTSMVHRVVTRGGRCLIPVFALGRAQELLLILDEYWQAHPELHNIPIYYASSLAKRCMAVYQTYSNMMNERIRKQIKVSNPFQFKHISNLRSMSHFDDVGPCVMMASPGMLQSGLSRELFEMWCVDKKNGVIIPGYVVQGTLGKEILSQPNSITGMNGNKLPVRLSIEYISFSAHVDYQQNSQFIDDVGSKNLILVHGESTEMGRLKSALVSKYAEQDDPVRIYTPRNCETVQLFFKGEKMAKTLGKLAECNPPEQGQEISGVLVVKDFRYSLLSTDEIQEYTTELVSTSINQKQIVPCRCAFSLVKWMLESMYGKVQQLGKESVLVFDAVKVTRDLETANLILEWEGNAVNDMVADSVLAIVLQAESSPAAVKATKSKCSHGHSHNDVKVKSESKLDEKVKKEHVEEEVEIILPPVDDLEESQEESEELPVFLTEFLKCQFGNEVFHIQRGTTEKKSDGHQEEEIDIDYVPTLTNIDEDIQFLKKNYPKANLWKLGANENLTLLLIDENHGTKIYSISKELRSRVSILVSKVQEMLNPLTK